MRGVVDMHCDTLSYLESEGRRDALEKRAVCGEAEQAPGTSSAEGGGRGTLRKNSGQLDLLRMRKGGYLLQNFAVYVDAGEHPDSWEWAMRLAKRFREEMEENADLIRQVLCYQDIPKNQKQGYMSALLTVEEGGICGGSISRLRKLYALGVRMMTLTWNYPNDLGCPAVLPEEMEPDERARLEQTSPRALTEKGREFVLEMEKLGIIPDVSHLSDEGFWEVQQITKKPFVASHSNARALCGHGRNLTDEMMRCIGERGGVIGLNFYEKFLSQAIYLAEKKPVSPRPEKISDGGESVGSGKSSADRRREFLDLLAAHAGRILRMGGEEALGLGSDFDGIPDNGIFPGAQCMEMLWDELHHRGFTERQLDKIFSENVLRVYREVLG